MKSTNEVLAETGLSYPMLNRLKDLSIIPKPKLKGRGRRKGVIGVFEDDVIDIINRVRSEQKLGLTLIKIAERLQQERNSLNQERSSLNNVAPDRKIIFPQNPSLMSSYVNTMPELYEQIEMENPGYRLHTIRLLFIESKEKRYLVPIEMVIVPKE